MRQAGDFTELFKDFIVGYGFAELSAVFLVDHFSNPTFASSSMNLGSDRRLSRYGSTFK